MQIKDEGKLWSIPLYLMPHRFSKTASICSNPAWHIVYIMQAGMMTLLLGLFIHVHGTSPEQATSITYIIMIFLFTYITALYFVKVIVSLGEVSYRFLRLHHIDYTIGSKYKIKNKVLSFMK